MEKETILILGAGASAPYGFPTGEALYEEICAGLLTGPLHDALLKLNYGKDLIFQFQRALQYCGASSVDAFLETRQEFMHIGKIAIAFYLVGCEKEENLFQNGDGKWYKYLLSKLFGASFDEFLSNTNKISILTYNYDRSLEHFIFTSLKNKYGLDDNRCAQMMRNIRIIHLHGSLGKLPWQNKDDSEFMQSYKTELRNLDNIVNVANSIKIVHEDTIGKDHDFETARLLIQGAERIFFLGFGYSKTNYGRLGIHKLPLNVVTGTAKGLTETEINKIVTDSRQVIRPDRQGYDVFQFLRNNKW